MDSLQKIDLLKNKFKSYDIDAYLVPSFDEFQNEFVPENLQRLRWLTGFTGSNGLALITKEQNYFFTDGRYITQAQKQINKNFKIYDIQDEEDIFLGVFKKILNIFFIGYDSSIFTTLYLERFSKYFRCNKKHIQFLPVTANLVDELWNRSKDFKTKSAFILNAKYTSQDEVTKINYVIKQLKADYILLTSPESICWLLNMRGTDLPYTPLVISYCLISKNGDIEIFSSLKKLKCIYKKIILSPFSKIKERILELNKQNKTIEYDPYRTPIWFVQNYKKENIIFKEDPCVLQKAKKDDVEIAGFQYAAIQDGIALTKLLNWLEENVVACNKITEIDVDEKLLELKKENPLFRTKSFETISSFAKNTAIIHYNPYEGENSVITRNNFYLLDCGSQYNFGTTDVTRTLYFGNPNKLYKLHYTLVLKGFINLCSLIFPINTTGQQIDAIARQFLWQHFLDYNHGTGHGVGSYLSVHEGPQAISKGNSQALKPKMVLSVEPGYYIPDKYGIRIENLVFISKVVKNNAFLEFQTLTLAPIAFNIIDKTLLTVFEKKWLLDYHKRIYATLAPFLNNSDRGYLNKHIKYYDNLL